MFLRRQNWHFLGTNDKIGYFFQMRATVKLRFLLACFLYEHEGLVITKIWYKIHKMTFFGSILRKLRCCVKITDFDKICHIRKMMRHRQTGRTTNKFRIPS